MNFAGGLVRMLFPFTLGMLLARRFRPVKVRGAFWICSAILAALFLVPALPTDTAVSLNGLFEVACIALVFPLLIRLGASGTTTDRFSTGLCRFMGDISFPVYIIHYPFMYLFYAWMIRHGVADFARTWPAALLLFFGNILLAYATLKLYDEPLRRRLAKVPAATGPLTRRRDRKKDSRTLGKVRESFSDGMPSGIRSRATRTASRRGASRRRRTCPR